VSWTSPDGPRCGHPCLLWYLEDYEGLGRRAGEILGDSAARLIVPTIVLAEARFITAKQKVALSWDQVIAAVSSDERFTAYPLTLDVLHRLSPDMEMHDAIFLRDRRPRGRIHLGERAGHYERPCDRCIRARGDRMVGETPPLSAGRMGLSTSQVGDLVAGLV